jgi:hypothetical protein
MNEASTFFDVYRAANGKFYLTREDQLVRTQSGGIVLFDTQRDVVEFLAEMSDVTASLRADRPKVSQPLPASRRLRCGQPILDRHENGAVLAVLE